MGFFIAVVMPVIYAQHAALDVTENALRNIWSNTSTRHKRACRAAKVMHRPIRYARNLGELSLSFGHALKVRFATTGNT